MGFKDEKTLKVSAIKNGTVIDHIPSNCLFKVISLLRLDKVEFPITFGSNLDSSKLGSKAIIKISDVFFEDSDINKIALIAPQVKLSIIKDYKVIEKKVVRVPDEVIGLAKCFNPHCISNHESITTRFQVLTDNGDIELKCKYCEKITDQEHMTLL